MLQVTVDMNAQVQVIVISWNGREDLERCLKSVAAQDYPYLECVVVDNHSTDGSPALVREKFPGIRLLALEENIGFSAANNYAIDFALADGVEYVMLINHDLFLTSTDTVSCLVSHLERRVDAGMASPLICYHDSEIIWWAASEYNSCWNLPVTLGIGEKYRGQFTGVADFNDWDPAACVLIKSDAIRKVGLLDTRFFYQVEDIEWGLRFRDAGYKLLSVYDVCVSHRVRSGQRAIASPAYAYYGERNLLLLSRMRQPLLQQGFYIGRRLIWLILRSVAHILPAYRERTVDVNARWKGFWDGLNGRFGRCDWHTL